MPSLLALYRKIKYGPVMLMYGVEREEVIEVLERNSARIIEVCEDDGAGKPWIDYRYCATKP